MAVAALRHSTARSAPPPSCCSSRIPPVPDPPRFTDKAAVDKRVKDAVDTGMPGLDRPFLGIGGRLRVRAQQPRLPLGPAADTRVTAGASPGPRPDGRPRPRENGSVGRAGQRGPLGQRPRPTRSGGFPGTSPPGGPALLDRHVRNQGDAHAAERYLSKRETGMGRSWSVPELAP